MIAVAALQRRESRGAPFRADFPAHAPARPACRSPARSHEALSRAERRAACRASRRNAEPMTSLPPLPALLVEPIVRAALLEDLGRAGDITTDAIVPADGAPRRRSPRARPAWSPGSTSRACAFRLIDPAVALRARSRRTAPASAPGDVIAAHRRPRARPAHGRARRPQFPRPPVSGIATATAAYVDGGRAAPGARSSAPARRTPGLRALEKYAVRCGGGINHRFGLDDAHADQGQPHRRRRRLATAIERARRAAGHLVKIEVEVDTLEQLEEALAFGIDAVLLDNMDRREAARRRSRWSAAGPITEASGGVTLETAAAIAATGVDLISMRLADAQRRRSRYRPRRRA